MSDPQFASLLLYAVSNIGKAGMAPKPEQLQAVRHIYEGRDVFVWLPAGLLLTTKQTGAADDDDDDDRGLLTTGQTEDRS